jgi:acetylglutamate kinase
MKKLTIIKVGGAIVEGETSLDALLKDFAKVAGNKILVHGGGRLATAIADKLGVESRMVGGRRITDEEMLRIVTMVYGGLVNKNIVARLQALGIDAVGLTGADMNIVRAEKRPAGTVDYGFAGDVKEVNAKTLQLLIENGFVPTLAPLTHDNNGQLLNTNADTIAGETAKALAPYYNVTLVYCFDKSGVLLDENDETSVIHRLNRTLYDTYVQSGVISGGMLPKLENALQAVEAGVEQVIITKASEILSGKGTIIGV